MSSDHSFVHGNDRLSGCWIVISNYIPFFSSEFLHKFEDEIFEVKQKKPQNPQKSEPLKFSDNMVAN